MAYEVLGDKDKRAKYDQFGPAFQQYAAGNGVGGIRSPWVDVPAATYFTGTTPAACREFGHTVAFDQAKMDSLYGNTKNYQSKFDKSVDELVKAGWYTESDGKKMKVEAAAALKR